MKSIRFKEPILIAILIIFYMVGTIGLLLPSIKGIFLSLSFFNLILSFTVILLARKSQFLRFALFLLLCFVVGMTVEWIGINTGLLFGNYSYGKNLGAKIYGVPWVIGLNWGLLVVSSASIVNNLKIGDFWKATFAALLMTGLDFLIEPVAVESDFWKWQNETIPVFNYVCWFVISLVLQVFYFKFKLVESNKVFNILFIILIVFFSLLTIF